MEAYCNQISHYFLALSTNCLRADLIILISQLTAGTGTVIGKAVRVNQTQLDNRFLIYKTLLRQLNKRNPTIICRASFA